MALSQSEKNRRYRAKQRALRSLSQKGPIEREKLSTFRTPFHQWLKDDGNWSEVSLAFASIGIEPPVFDDDRGAFSTEPDEFENANWQSMANPYEQATNSLGRATMMVGTLVELASSFAALVNRYMIEELEVRLSELDASDIPRDLADLARTTLRSQSDGLKKPEIIRMKKWKP